MTTSRIETFGAHPATVFEALLDAAEGLGLRMQVLDARRNQATIRREGKSYRLSASVTDNGLGEALVHLSWDPPGSGGASKLGKRLLKETARSLTAMESRPPPPPAP